MRGSLAGLAYAKLTVDKQNHKYLISVERKRKEWKRTATFSNLSV